MEYNVIFSHNFINKTVLLWGWNKMTGCIWHLYIKEVMKRLMVVGSWSDFFDVHYSPPHPPTGILHLSLPEWVAHTFMYINDGAFITSLSTYLDKSMVGFFSCVQFPFWWHFCFLINSRQSIYLKPVFCFFFFFKCISAFSAQLHFVWKLLRFMNIWGAFFRNGGLEIHRIPLYIVSF